MKRSEDGAGIGAAESRARGRSQRALGRSNRWD